MRLKDNGMGVSKEDWLKIFEPFKRINYKVDGKGLGLYLVKIQVEAMGGNVEIESELGHGATFTIQLPNPIKQ